MRRAIVIALLCLSLSGCATPLPTPSTAPVGSPSPATSSLNPNLHLSNGTTLTVTLVVKGQHIGDYPPGGSDPTIKLATLPPLPWKAEARSPSGRVLTSLVVQPGDGQPNTGTGQFVDLACGRIWIWIGDVRPDAPVPAIPSKPGDCAP